MNVLQENKLFPASDSDSTAAKPDVTQCPIPVQSLDPPINGRSTLMRLRSNEFTPLVWQCMRLLILSGTSLSLTCRMAAIYWTQGFGYHAIALQPPEQTPGDLWSCSRSSPGS